MSPASAQAEHVLLTVLIQIIIIIAAARIFGLVLRWLGQPQVCGEIAAGLILGPSVLGRLFPAFHAQLFPASVAPIFTTISQIGLILMMFLIGMEFDFGHLQRNLRTAASVSLSGVVLPLALGFTLGLWMFPQLGHDGRATSFALFMAAAMSITAIPVLGRIMLELNLTRTRLGSLTICAAAFDDASGWILLALVTAIARSAFDPTRFAVMAIESMAFAAFMVWIARPVLGKWARSVMKGKHGELAVGDFAILLIILLVAALCTNLIGIFSIFGAFLLGAVLYDQHEFRKAAQQSLGNFVTVFFVPLFFTYTGLRTDIGSMEGGVLWMMCGLVILAAVAGKFGGCALAARSSGLRWREASIIGVLMNTRGLMELIVINVGYDLGVIPKSVFFMLVLMAVITTFAATPVLRRLVRASEVEQEYLSSEFATRLGDAAED